jgi:hypothetical protein
MPLSWNEIKDRALTFSREWADEASEDAEAKSFWDAFFTVFGVPRRRVASFETRVKKIDGKDGTVCGRLESRYRYSPAVYDSFPWPQGITGKQRQAVEAAAQGVLAARAYYPDASLAALYDHLTTPPELVKAHRKLDAAVDAAYGKRKFTGDRDRLAFLLALYQQMVSPLSAKQNRRRK